MPLLDDRGRLFGKINLIDFSVAFVALLLIPLGYAGYQLFKTPPPEITDVAPRTVKHPKGGDYLIIQGQHLRPFLRAFAGTNVAEYLFASPDRAQIKLPPLEPGEYELKLFDEAQLAASGGKITVLPEEKPVVQEVKPPPPDDPQVAVAVLGTFGRLESAQASMIRPGLRLSLNPEPNEETRAWLEVLSVQPPRRAMAAVSGDIVNGAEVRGREQVTAVVRLQSRLVGRDLLFEDKRVAPGTEFVFPIPRPRPKPVEASADSAGRGAPPPPSAPPGPPKTLPFNIVRVYPEQMPVVDLLLTPVSVRVIGSFNGLSQAQAAAIRPGTKLAYRDRDQAEPPESIEVLAVQPPVAAAAILSDNLVVGAEMPGRFQVVSAVRLKATLVGRELMFRDTRVLQNVELNVPLAVGTGAAANRPVSFIVQRVFPERTTMVDLDMRFVTRPDIVAAVNRDLAPANSAPDLFKALTPQVLSLRVTEELLGQSKVELREGKISIAEGRVRVPAVRTLDGWFFDGKPLRAGFDLMVDSVNWSITGTILAVHANDSAKP